MHCSSQGSETTWCSVAGASDEKQMCSTFSGSTDPQDPNSCSTFGTYDTNKSKCSVFGLGFCSVVEGEANAECTTLLTDMNPPGPAGGQCSAFTLGGLPYAEQEVCSVIRLTPEGPVFVDPPVGGKCVGVPP